MATRAMIGELTPEGYVRAVYAHWDGYARGGVGETLATHYADSAEISELIDGGDLSSLGTHAAGTLFYRDRGETDVEPEIYYIEDFVDCQDYNYVWTGTEWLVGTGLAWYRLNYLLKASIEDIHEFVSQPEPA